jgi:hypothetical protein
MKYKLLTFQDVFDKVPVDRIKDCLSEMAGAMVEAKNLEKNLDDGVTLKCAGFEWVDEGKEEITVEVQESTADIDIGSPRVALKAHTKEE